jgi:hypothetical protein
MRWLLNKTLKSRNRASDAFALTKGTAAVFFILAVVLFAASIIVSVIILRKGSSELIKPMPNPLHPEAG